MVKTKIKIKSSERKILYCKDCGIKNDCIHYNDTREFVKCAYYMDEVLK